MPTELLSLLNPDGTTTPDARKLLLIDDDLNDLEYLWGMLAARGNDVVPCADFSRGADLVTSGRFDLILVSQGGQEFRAAAVIERARERVTPPPVLVMARVADMECYLLAMELGAADYVEKPLPP